MGKVLLAAAAALLASCGSSSPTRGGGTTVGGGTAGGCTPTTCAAQGKNCGTISDGCGGTLACGDCASGQSCGAGGTANVCGTGAACTPTTCAAQGKNCGSIPDGCGGTIDCGSCGTGQTCQASACVASACEPATCQSLRAACGDIGDGCGGTLHCGNCPGGSSCSQNACVAPGEQRGSTRWARREGHGADSVSIDFGHFGVLVDGSVLETWSTAGDKTSSAEISAPGNDDIIVAGPSFVLARGFTLYRGNWISLYDWSGAWQRSVGSTNDYGDLDVPAVSSAGRIAWTDLNPPGGPPPAPSSLHVEDADGSNLRSWTSTDMRAGSVTFDPQGDIDVVIGAGHPGTFLGRSFGASGPETALVQLDPGGDVRWTRDLPFSNALPAIGTTAIGTVALAGEGHFVAVERVDGTIRFDAPADGNLLAVDPKGRAAIAGGGSVAYYDLTGAMQWSRSFDARIRGVAIADDGSVVIVGDFQGTVDFGTGSLTAEPGGSGFVVDLAP